MFVSHIRDLKKMKNSQQYCVAQPQLLFWIILESLPTSNPWVCPSVWKYTSSLHLVEVFGPKFWAIITKEYKIHFCPPTLDCQQRLRCTIWLVRFSGPHVIKQIAVSKTSYTVIWLSVKGHLLESQLEFTVDCIPVTFWGYHLDAKSWSSWMVWGMVLKIYNSLFPHLVTRIPRRLMCSNDWIHE